MSLYKEKIPATLHYENPNPQIDFDNSPFYVCDSLTDWQRSEKPRRAGVSSFGVGGTNAHILLQEAPVYAPPWTAEPGNDLPVSILPISGVTQEALSANASALANHLDQIVNAEQTLNVPISGIANTLQTGRDEFSYRAAIVTDHVSDAAEVLNTRQAPRFMKRKATPSVRDIIFMFPGQGSQYVRMGQNLYQHSEIFRENLDRCAEILTPLLDRDLREILFPPASAEQSAKEILNNTRFTQPALFSLSYSLAQVWLTWGIKPAAVMGHSIGEFAAACIAGVFKLEDGLKMIAERGRAMQVLPGGSMLSVRLPGSQIEPMLWGDMAVGSYNGPNLCVVAGPHDQVSELQKQLESNQAVCRHLHTSHAFHSPMMDEVIAPFSDFISQFNLSEPDLPILSTVTGKWMTTAQATDARYWAEHLRQPVRFSDAVMNLWSEDSSRILIELGPRNTLATLSKQHASDPKNQLAIAALSNNAEGLAEWHAMMAAVAQLWLAGTDIQWGLLSTDGKPKIKIGPNLDLPTYEFQRKRYFIKPGCSGSQNHANPNSIPVTAPIQCSEGTSSTSQPNALSSEVNSMSRIQNIVTALEGVFENTSGFDLTEFDGETTFFEMGLDSLVLTQTATALNKEMNADVTFRQLLEETPTVNSLASWLDNRLPVDMYAVSQSPAESSGLAPDPGTTSAVALPRGSSVASSAAAEQQPVVAQSQPSQPFQQAQPVKLQAMPPTPIAVMPGNATQAIIQSQLQVMAAQLQMLGCQPAAQMNPADNPTAQPVMQLVKPVVNDVPSLPSAAIEQPSAFQPESADEALPTAVEQSLSETTQTKRFNTVKLSEGELDAHQVAALEEMIRLNNLMMPKSKQYAQQHRRYLADPRTVAGFRPNMKEMTHPIVVERSKGALLWDIDGNEYIDFTCGFGSNLLGHTHEVTVKAISEQVQKDYAIGPQSPLAGEVAKLFCELTGNERMAFSNTGSEAVLGCTRLARNATGRELIVMFNGDYHGILDEVISRGSKKLKSFPAATGIPQTHVENTLILDYGTDESLQVIRERMNEIAAVLVEPVQSRTPELQPRAFLQELRKMTENEPTCLIFDEVISGLRIGLGGAQDYFGVKADLASYGKVVGGGMPIGIVAGKAKYMDGFDGGFWQYGDDSRPEAGMTYFAGTFVRHPLTLAASRAILLHLKEGGQPMYDRLNQLSQYLADELNKVFVDLDAPMTLAHFGSLFKIQFQQELLYSEVFFAGLRRRGMHIWDHRPCLLTLAHDKSHVDQLVEVVREATIEAQRYGFMPGEGYKKYPRAVDANRPPVVNAKKGKDKSGNPGWFLPDSGNPGQFIQVGFPVN